MKNIVEIIFNLGTLISFSMIAGYLESHFSTRASRAVGLGLIFGVGTVLGMINPLVLEPGIFFDGRSMLLSICALFFGFSAAAIAGVMSVGLRLWQAGAGSVVGILVIVSAILIGLVFRRQLKSQNAPVPTKVLIHMGFSVHVVMMALMFLMPNNRGIVIFKTIGWLILLVYPLAVVLAGAILSEFRQNRELHRVLMISQEELEEAYGQLEQSYADLIQTEAANRDHLDRLLISEARFRLIVDEAPVGINMSDLHDGIIFKANKAFADIVGRSIEEVEGGDWMQITHPEDVAESRAAADKMREDPSALAEFDKRYVKPNGEIVWANVRVMPIGGEEAHPASEISFVYNITERKKTLEALAASEKNFRNIFEGASDAMLLLRKGKVYDCNWSAAHLLGDGTLESVIGRNLLDFSDELQPNGISSEKRLLEAKRACKLNAHHRMEWFIRRHDGTLVPGDVMLTTLDFQGETMIHAVFRDMTEQKQLERQLAYLSYHDQLTGLYNRRFFEEELIRIDAPRNLPITMIMADVNNLKLINDSFGHAVGDQLLIKAAHFIQQSARKGEIVARIGGDEFMILLPSTSDEEANKIVNRIQSLAAKNYLEGLEISISFGLASKTDTAQDIVTIMKRAEDSLYKQKLFESPSVRGRTIQTIIHTLHEKNKREEQHSRRVSAVCEVIGRALKLPESEIRELQSMGLLHDIGKIAIDEQILNNPGQLSEEDWIQMRKHPEIGYRILSTVNDMSEMAEDVLAHHERWDGKGYPKGISSEDIPLKARIICIADAYDAMTSDRSYRQAMTRENALDEILKHAGTQFDPTLASLFVHKMREEGIAV